MALAAGLIDATDVRLALFDLDHTLLHGDSDVLWCDYLIERGMVDAVSFAVRNADMESRYKAGTVGAQEFANFYVGTLAGHTPQDLAGLRSAFFSAKILPRIGDSARELVKHHLAADDWVVMTTATNRFITELTAAHFGIDYLIATEPELVDGVFSGRTTGTLNMREGKVVRLHAWLDSRSRALSDFESTAYSDSINDLPLLMAADHAVVVNPDDRLKSEAQARGWQEVVLTLQ